MTTTHEVPPLREIHDPELIQLDHQLTVEETTSPGRTMNSLHSVILKQLEWEAENFRANIMPRRGTGIRRDIMEYWHAGRLFEEAAGCLNARIYRVFLKMIPIGVGTAQGYINMYVTFEPEEFVQFASYREAEIAYREIRKGVVGEEA